MRSNSGKKNTIIGQEGQKVVNQFRSVAKIRNLLNFAVLSKFATCENFAALLIFFLLLSASLFFWFLICSYECNLTSSWLS